MEVLRDSGTLVIVASHLEPIYRELGPPYLEVCAIPKSGPIRGYQHYVESYPGLLAPTESLSELVVLLRAGEFLNNKNQIGLNHYRRIFSLNPHASNFQNHTQDFRHRYSSASAEAEFLHIYIDKIVIPIPLALGTSLYDHFLTWHASLERALDVACLAFDESVKEKLGIIDSKSDLKNTKDLYAWNMWIGNPDFYNEWVELLFPVLKALDDISGSLPNEGIQSRWSGFVSERLFTVYINHCRSTNRWNFVERPVILFEDSAVIERDSAVIERDSAVIERDSAVAGIESMLKSKSWAATIFLRVGERILKRLLLFKRN